MGQKIGEATAFISAPVHSSVSGKVISLEERVHPASQEKDLAIIIENNGENQIDPSIQPPGNFEELTAETLLKIIREKGLVGLGGEMFPTYVKLSSTKPIDTLIVNGCE